MLVVSRNRGFSLALVYGGVTSIFGYSLLVAFSSLFAVPWQVTNGVLALTLVAAMFVPAVRRSVTGALPEFLFASRRSWPALLVVLVIGLFQFGVAAIEPEQSIDGQLYHGPILANIVQSGSLWDWSAANQYIFYTDLTMAGGVNLATFTGQARFDNAVQVPHLLLLILIINWALSKRISSPFLRIALAGLIVSAPVIWLQPRVLYVDVAYGTAVVGAILLAVLVPDFRRFDVLVAGVLVAAVFATKPTGILTGLLLLAVLVVAVLIRRRVVSRIRSTNVVVILGFGVPLVLGMSFYIRNFIQFANPVYPVQAAFGPLSLPGIIDLSVFESGDRGSGLIDPSRIATYLGSVGYGMMHGVTKLDYDPRVGGFGYVTVFALIAALLLILLQVVARQRAGGGVRAPGPLWRAQIAIVLICAGVLLVQPSSFDARYTIGPTVGIITAVLMTSIAVLPAIAQLVIGLVVLVVAFGQVVWTEKHMYPGVQTELSILHGPISWQANTPGSPRPPGLQVAWLPEVSGKCVTIALQTSGGLTPSGMSENSSLGTLSYGLYGDELCNRVIPITLRDGQGPDPAADSATIASADYLVLYANDLGQWEAAVPDLSKCLTPVYSIQGAGDYLQNEVVMHNACN